MLTLNQLNKKKRKKSKKIAISKALEQNPQKKGICQKVFTMSPKKPNSAIRKIAKIKLTNNKIITAYIPGIGFCIQEHNFLLIKGGKTQDLPSLKYKVIRGALDAAGVKNRINSRSKYGVKKTINK